MILEEVLDDLESEVAAFIDGARILDAGSVMFATGSFERKGKEKLRMIALISLQSSDMNRKTTAV